MDRPRPGGRHQRPADLVPGRKVSAGALSGALATLVLWLVDLTGVDVPARSRWRTWCRPPHIDRL